MANNKNLKSSGVKKISSTWLIFFLVWPFGALVHALKRFRQPHSKIIFWLFCIFFGFVFIIPDDVPGAADSARYARQLIELHNQSISWSYLLTLFYNPYGGFVDIYQPLVTWLIASFTDNPRILMAAFGAVFGFFYAQNLWMIFMKIPAKIGWLLFFFMLAYALANPIWNINGVRMWTAAQIFLFGVLRIFLENDRKGWIWVASSTIVHFSFMFPFVIILVFRFIPLNLPLFFALYLGASFINEINLELVRNSLSFLPEAFQPRVEGYTDEEYAIMREEAAITASWHVKFSEVASRWIGYLWIIAIFYYRQIWIKNEPTIKQLFALSLFIGSFAQIASLIPSGGRFMVIANSILYAILILIIGQNYLTNKLKALKLATYPLLGFSLIFSIRIGMEFIGISTLVSNFFLSSVFEDQVPLIHFIKQFFE